MKKSYLLYTILLLLLSGCIPKTHTLHLYNLNVESSHKRVSKSNKTLKVNYPTALNALSGSRIYYNDNSKIGYYLYSRWSSSLNKMLYSNIITNLQSNGKYRYVVGYNTIAKADYELEVEIDSFNHMIIGDQSYANIKLKVQLIESSSGKVVKQRVFRYKIPLEAKNAAAFAKGARKAVEEFINDLVTF